MVNNQCWEMALQVEHQIKDQNFHTQSSQRADTSSYN